MATDERVLSVIQRLMAKEASLRKIGTPEALNEAEVAATKVAEFCLRNKISAEQVAMDSGQARRASIESEYYQYDGTEEYLAKKGAAWEIQLAGSVARAHDCRIIVGRGYFVFVGEAEDRAVSMTMFRILRREVTTACTAGYRRQRSLGMPTRGYIASFFASSVGRITRRYQEMRARVVAETSATALVLATDTKLDQFIEDLGLEKTKTKQRGSLNQAGIHEGRAFGSRVSLSSSAVGSGGQPAGQIRGG